MAPRDRFPEPREAPSRARRSHRLREEVAEYFEGGLRVTPGDTVVDVGANIGAFALRVAEATGGAVTVHCFEPSPPTYDALADNFATNALLCRTPHTLNRLGLGDPERSGSIVPFHHFDRLPTDSTYDLRSKRLEFESFFSMRARALERAIASALPVIGPTVGRYLRRFIEYVSGRQNRFGNWLADRYTGRRTFQCRVESLADWVERAHIERIDVLKIDVEGAELDVLTGVGGAWPLVRSVAVETTSEHADAIRALLDAKGFLFRRQTVPRITAETGLTNVILVASRAPLAARSTPAPPCQQRLPASSRRPRGARSHVGRVASASR